MKRTYVSTAPHQIGAPVRPPVMGYGAARAFMVLGLVELALVTPLGWTWAQAACAFGAVWSAFTMYRWRRGGGRMSGNPTGRSPHPQTGGID